nr:hypothetical protein [uncultured Lachnoanaerobaculum sp.]
MSVSVNGPAVVLVVVD